MIEELELVHIQRKTPEKSEAFLTPHRYQCDVIIWCSQQDLNLHVLDTGP